MHGTTVFNVSGMGMPVVFRWLVTTLVIAMGVSSASVAGHDSGDPLDDVGTRHDLVPLSNGTFLMGLIGVGVANPDGNGTGPLDVDPVSWKRWITETPACDRRLFVDLDYAPQNLTGPDGSPLEVAYTFRVTATQGDHSGDVLVPAPTQHLYLTTVPQDVPVIIDLVLLTGVDVAWSFRVEGRQDFAAAGCEPGPL